VPDYRSWSRVARGRTDGLEGGAKSPTGVPPQVGADTAVRRRRALGLLLGAIALPALVALATGSTAAWWVFVGMLPVFGIYLVVVLYARRVQAEREINVAFGGSAIRGRRSWDDVLATRDSQLDEVSA
jgi:hypothetical protein